MTPAIIVALLHGGPFACAVLVASPCIVSKR
jgi:hypothetical protein